MRAHPTNSPGARMLLISPARALPISPARVSRVMAQRTMIETLLRTIPVLEEAYVRSDPGVDIR